jgi:hypothetical protein
MNDLEEVRFGIIQGSLALKNSVPLREALEREERHAIFTATLDGIIAEFERKHLLDTYVLCFSEHMPDDWDGLLSMWRGYGGLGRGAAIMVDTQKLKPIDTSPIILAEVKYQTTEERHNWFQNTAKRFAPVLAKANLPDSKLYLAANALFDRLKLFSLFSKHKGFNEEREWRVVYLSDRDSGERLRPMLHYVNGSRGIEPKLRLKIQPLDGVLDDEISLDRLVDRILLGPSVSSPLAKRSVQRMLELIERSDMTRRVHASSIPFRTL